MTNLTSRPPIKIAFGPSNVSRTCPSFLAYHNVCQTCLSLSDSRSNNPLVRLLGLYTRSTVSLSILTVTTSGSLGYFWKALSRSRSHSSIMWPSQISQKKEKGIQNLTHGWSVSHSHIHETGYTGTSVCKSWITAPNIGRCWIMTNCWMGVAELNEW